MLNFAGVLKEKKYEDVVSGRRDMVLPMQRWIQDIDGALGMRVYEAGEPATLWVGHEEGDVPQGTCYMK